MYLAHIAFLQVGKRTASHSDDVVGITASTNSFPVTCSVNKEGWFEGVSSNCLGILQHISGLLDVDYIITLRGHIQFLFSGTLDRNLAFHYSGIFHFELT